MNIRETEADEKIKYPSQLNNKKHTKYQQIFQNNPHYYFIKI